MSGKKQAIASGSLMISCDLLDLAHSDNEACCKDQFYLFWRGGIAVGRIQLGPQACAYWSLSQDQALDSHLVPPLAQKVMVSRRPLVALLLSPPILASASSAFVAPRAASFPVSASQRALASRRATVSVMPHRMASTQQPATTFSIDAPPAPGNPFHLAFPVRDIEESRKFYGDVLGCTQGRIGERLPRNSIQNFRGTFTGLCLRYIIQ